MRGHLQAIFCLLVLPGFRGSSAQRNPFRGRPGRNCNRPCPSNYDPVCGSDGQTYDNRCNLNYARECFNRRVWVRHRSTCDCSGQCPSDYVPVCGTDNQTYTNRCVLARARRCQNKQVRFQHRGQCRTSSTSNPNCNPTGGCTFNYDPVCGTDGRTYSNECGLQNAACYDSNLSKAYDGECASSTNPNCRQTAGCPFNLDPVCGSDGTTYSNQCLFENAACRIPNLVKVNDGACGQTTDLNCDHFRVCTFDYSPVCGSDGRTYSNLCLLDVQRCEDPNLSKAHDGECGSTTNPVCNQFAACPAHYAPVCGSDGRTYGNQCNLDFAKCSNPSLRKVHDGECRTTPNPNCNQARACPANYAPVCGSDGRTYGNQCALNTARCNNPSLSKLHDGECSQVNSNCKQTLWCPEIYAPLCGTDGKTYENECTFSNAACSNLTLEKAYDGQCSSFSTFLPFIRPIG